MLLDFIFNPPRANPSADFLEVDGRRIPLVMVRHLRARRYLLRLRPDGSARVTLPRRGSSAEGKRFAERHVEWIAGQLKKLAARPVGTPEWNLGTEILFRGERLKLETAANEKSARLGEETIHVNNACVNLRPEIERHLWKIAIQEFPPRVRELAAKHQLTVVRVTVRNQRSRWGSCSRRGTISLNWRLIQAPEFVRDYIVLHELMHLRQMNHSPRFWREVEKVCPDYETAERWLKQHSSLLH